jgi:hypothetical protein
LIAEFAAKENLKSSFPLRFKARRAERGVDIRVECVTPDGLSGKKRVWFRGIFHLIGILGESPFVSKLRKAESAQHSMQWTGGRLKPMGNGNLSYE